jgi:hypothetical protein
MVRSATLKAVLSACVVAIPIAFDAVSGRTRLNSSIGLPAISHRVRDRVHVARAVVFQSRFWQRKGFTRNERNRLPPSPCPASTLGEHRVHIWSLLSPALREACRASVIGRLILLDAPLRWTRVSARPYLTERSRNGYPQVRAVRHNLPARLEVGSEV